MREYMEKEEINCDSGEIWHRGRYMLGRKKSRNVALWTAIILLYVNWRDVCVCTGLVEGLFAMVTKKIRCLVENSIVAARTGRAQGTMPCFVTSAAPAMRTCT